MHIYPLSTPPEYQNLPFLKHYAGPIAIDLGNSHIRAGYAGSEEFLEFKNYVYKQNNHNIYIGNISNKSQKQIFDPATGLLQSSEYLEYVLDYIFAHLSVTDDKVSNPVIMTEAVCNPLACRKISNELLFELYQTSKVSYGIDSVFSCYYNQQLEKSDPFKLQDGLIFSSGNNYTYWIPIVEGKSSLTQCKRIGWGSKDSVEYLNKLIQFKVPDFPHSATNDELEDMLYRHCYTPCDYKQELAKFSSEANENDSTLIDENTVAIQFPFPFVEKPTEQEKQEILQKKIERQQKFKQIQEQNRLNKLKTKEELLMKLTTVKNLKSMSSKAEFTAALSELGFKKMNELDQAITECTSAIEKIQKRIQGIVEEPAEKEPPSFHLLNVADSLLTEEEQKQKRIQRLQKAGYDARIKKNNEKKLLQLELERQEKIEDEKRNKDLPGYLADIRNKRNKIIQEIRSKTRKKLLLQDRKSHLSQARMRNITSLVNAESDEKGKKSKRKRKGSDEDDDFGANDDDWDVYRDINKDEESSGEEENSSLLSKYTDILLQYSTPEELEREPLIDPFNEIPGRHSNSILNKLKHGYWKKTEGEGEDAEEEDLELQSRLYLNVERIRVPQIIFDPGMIGIDQAGVGECFDFMLNGFSPEVKKKLIKNVFVTGGHCRYENFLARLKCEIQPRIPLFSTPLGNQYSKPKVIQTSTTRYAIAQDLTHDAFYGARLYAQQCHSHHYKGEAGGWITRSDYNEYGHDYLKEHFASNCY